MVPALPWAPDHLRSPPRKQILKQHILCKFPNPVMSDSNIQLWTDWLSGAGGMQRGRVRAYAIRKTSVASESLYVCQFVCDLCYLGVSGQGGAGHSQPPDWPFPLENLKPSVCHACVLPVVLVRAPSLCLTHHRHVLRIC